MNWFCSDSVNQLENTAFLETSLISPILCDAGKSSSWDQFHFEEPSSNLTLPVDCFHISQVCSLALRLSNKQIFIAKGLVNNMNITSSASGTSAKCSHEKIAPVNSSFLVCVCQYAVKFECWDSSASDHLNSTWFLNQSCLKSYKSYKWKKFLSVISCNIFYSKCEAM